MAEPALPVWAREDDEKILFAAAVGYGAPAVILLVKQMTKTFVDVRRGSASCSGLAPTVRLGLEELLTSTGAFNANLIRRMRHRFSGQVIQAVNEQLPLLAREIYLQTEALPQTETEHHLNIIGYKLNDFLNVGNDACQVCYKGTKTFLLKALTPKEHLRANALHGDTNQHLTSFELLSHAPKNFMIMPYYISSLEAIATLSVDDGRRVVEHVSEALMFLHNKGFIHMDVKPANICLNEAGDAVLVDLGSVMMRSCPTQPSTSECTVAYMPLDFQPRPPNDPGSNSYVAEELCDWWMLAMTVAQMVFGVKIGGAASPPNRLALRDMLQTEFSELAARLTID